MQYNQLGRSGLQVSAICLGTLMFGSYCSDAEAERMVRMAEEAGVNFVDTADSYSDGQSETVLGRLIRDARHDWVVATKVGNPIGGRPMEGGLSRKWLLRSIDMSLKRLGLEHVDIWYLHLPDPLTNLEETLRTVADVIRSGKALHWGFTNYRGWEIGEIVRVADLLGMPRPVVCQAYYNLVNRSPEFDILPACDHFGIGVATYSPLARGILTGKYKAGSPIPEDSRAARGDRRLMQMEFRKESMEVADAVQARARARGMTSIDFALLWLLNNQVVSSVVAGPKSSEQWQDYLGCLKHGFTAEDEAFFDSLVPPGMASTPGFYDPKFPPMGRKRLRFV